jgi:Fe2+ or Zn2+ uptake regulation protein
VHRIEANVSARHGFRPTHHKLEIYGLCGECIAAGVAVTPQGLTCPIETV